MPKTFGFLKIGEANAEIEKLTTERDALKVRAEAAEQNVTDLTEQAEAARKESENAGTNAKALTDEKAAHDSTKQKLAKTETDLKSAQANQSDFDVKVEKAASQKAQQILGGIGQPPIQSNADANPAAPKTDLSQLKGLARVKAAFAAKTSTLK